MKIICGAYTSAKHQQWRTRLDENCWSYFHENFTRDVHWNKEVFIAIWKSSVECRPYQAPSLHAPAQIIFLVLILEMWISMTVDFLNIVANAARRRYLCLREGLHSLSALVIITFYFFFLLHHSCYKLVLYSVGSPGCLLPPLESITLLIICAVSSTTLFCNSPGARLHQLLLLVIPVGDAIWFCPRSFSFFFFLFFSATILSAPYLWNHHS